MAKSCCEAKACEVESLRVKQSGVLKWVLLINVVMFFLEFILGFLSHSSALMADSLDMLGDAAIYALSLYALNRGALWRARAGLSKGIVMALLGLGVLIQTLYRFSMGATPIPETMGIVGLLALAANSVCLFLLYKHRSDDINMKSIWICSRNDIISNVGVIVASLLVAATGSGIPDWSMGFLVATLFLRSSFSVIREAQLELSLIQRN